MEPARAGTDVRDSRFDGLHAEATAAVGYSANTLRSVRERYREAYADDARPLAGAARRARRRRSRAARRAPGRPSSTAPVDRAADAAEAGADDARRRALRGDVDTLTTDLGDHQAELAKLELAERTPRGDLAVPRARRRDAARPRSAARRTAGDLQMRIVEAQEAERSRLAQEVHDGPAQALSNAIFQVEYIERVIESDPLLARTELRFLRELLRRELGDVRAFISQLRPPVLDELGLDGAIADTVEHMRTLTGLDDHDRARRARDRPARRRPADGRPARRPGSPAECPQARGGERSSWRPRLDDDGWVLEVRDDGRGFDIGAVAARGRRNFGLQFMRERAELIGARFDVRSRPDGGTVVRLAIPTEPAVGGEESR